MEEESDSEISSDDEAPELEDAGMQWWSWDLHRDAYVVIQERSLGEANRAALRRRAARRCRSWA